MFSVYGVTDRVFSGTLEEMNRVRELARAPLIARQRPRRHQLAD